LGLRVTWIPDMLISMLSVEISESGGKEIFRFSIIPDYNK
jgi:hypothetical protein